MKGRGRDGEGVEPEGPKQQSQAAHAEREQWRLQTSSACNMDETGAPCRTVRGPRASLDLTVCFSMCL